MLNPPAFPHKTKRNTSSDPLATPREFQETGMTLRDYFRGQLAPALLGKVVGHGNLEEVAAYIALNAYQFADAMLEARTSIVSEKEQS